jgi:hypothetical protein
MRGLPVGIGIFGPPRQSKLAAVVASLSVQRTISYNCKAVVMVIHGTPQIKEALGTTLISMALA